jgi:hypothetical protein
VSKNVEIFFTTELLKVQPSTIQVALALATLHEDTHRDTLYSTIVILNEAPEPKDGNMQPIIDAAVTKRNEVMDKLKRACPGVRHLPGAIRFM